MQCNESGKMQELKDIRAVLKKKKKEKKSQNKMQPNWVHKAPKKFRNFFKKSVKKNCDLFSYLYVYSISSFSLSEAFW